jgi:hypothetical protein
MENQTITHADLAQFSGTENYYRYHSLLLTDGAFYLAEKAECFWLMDVIWSHAMEKHWYGKEDFITCKLTVQDTVGDVVFDDGNGRILVTQHIPFTDFPLDHVQLFIVQGESNLVVMLPGEY